MGIINVASGNSIWRGLDYYKENKVKSYKKINDFEIISTVSPISFSWWVVHYEGIVIGSNKEKYNVFMNVEHPRSSKCNCPHAKDKKIICKHIIALYFTVFPKEVDSFIENVEKAEKEYEDYEKETYNKTIKYINSMSKQELIDSLTEILNIAPEWVYERFVRYNVGC